MSKISNLKRVSKARNTFNSLDIHVEAENNLAWYFMNAQPRSCFTPELLGNIYSWFELLNHDASYADVEFIVLASKTPGIFSLGGDLNLFVQHIQAKNRQALMDYAMACVDVLYINNTGLNRKVTTLSLVKGDALGGGFEAAISSDVLIAERSAKMGLPEILFNLFPGMGALSFLTRKIGQVKAEQMILSGKLFTAEELFSMGVVDILVNDGEGERAVYEYIKKEKRAQNGYRALRMAKQCCNPVSYEELVHITTVWVDAALMLTDKDLRMMQRLVKRQSAKVNQK